MVFRCPECDSLLGGSYPSTHCRKEHGYVSLFMEWLAETYKLQREAYGVDPAELDRSEFADYINYNVLAAHTELSEFLQELPTKPWINERGRPDPVKRFQAVNEAIDVLHFVGNLLVALRCTDEELNTLYCNKMRINRERRQQKYQGRVEVVDET